MTRMNHNKTGKIAQIRDFMQKQCDYLKEEITELDTGEGLDFCALFDDLGEGLLRRSSIRHFNYLRLST